MLTEIAHAPKIMTNISAIIQPEQLKKDLDSYLKNRAPATFPSQLRNALQVRVHKLSLQMFFLWLQSIVMLSLICQHMIGF